jgi:hypothetical protein
MLKTFWLLEGERSSKIKDPWLHRLPKGTRDLDCHQAEHRDSHQASWDKIHWDTAWAGKLGMRMSCHALAKITNQWKWYIYM